MMLQVKNLSKIALCASLLMVAAPQAIAETATNTFSVSATLTVEFAQANYTDGSKELFQWSEIPGICTAQTPWRVLTHDEWSYLLVTRAGGDKNALGQVNGVNGLIILPDNWTQPAGAPVFQPDDDGITFANNHYTTDQWNLMATAGAVFLPCKGASADGIHIDDATDLGAYWASTAFSDDNAYCMRFYEGYIHDQNNAAKSFYHCLRLVKDAGTPTAIQSSNSPYSEADRSNEVRLEIFKSSNNKLFHNGQLYILHNGKTYTPTGAEVK